MSAATDAVQAALGQVGTPYVYGAERPGFGFDCSGLVQYVYGKVGITLPRTAAQQQGATSRISAPMPGDLVFYGSPAHHVGLYLGSGKMIAAPHTGDKVKVQSVYAATDGPYYGRVTGSGAGTLSSAATSVKQAATSAGGNLSQMVTGSLEKIVFVGLGLALIGAGAYKAVAPKLKGAS